MIQSDKQLIYVLEVLRNTSREVLGKANKLNKQNSTTGLTRAASIAPQTLYLLFAYILPPLSCNLQLISV